MAAVLLISENKIKNWTALDDNVQVDDIVPFVFNAQDLYLEQSLGTKFYNRLKDGVANNNLVQKEKDLLNAYIAQMLMNYALYLAIPALKYKLTNASILVPKSETADSTSLDEVKWLRQTVLDTAEYYDKRLRLFLYENPGLFTEYDIPGVTGVKPQKQSPYFSGLVIPKSKKSYDADNSAWQCDECFGDDQTWG